MVINRRDCGCHVIRDPWSPGELLPRSNGSFKLFQPQTFSWWKPGTVHVIYPFARRGNIYIYIFFLEGEEINYVPSILMMNPSQQ